MSTPEQLQGGSCRTLCSVPDGGRTRLKAGCSQRRLQSDSPSCGHRRLPFQAPGVEKTVLGRVLGDLPRAHPQSHLFVTLLLLLEASIRETSRGPWPHHTPTLLFPAGRLHQATRMRPGFVCKHFINRGAAHSHEVPPLTCTALCGFTDVFPRTAASQIRIENTPCTPQGSLVSLLSQRPPSPRVSNILTPITIAWSVLELHINGIIKFSLWVWLLSLNSMFEIHQWCRLCQQFILFMTEPSQCGCLSSCGWTFGWFPA